MKVLFDTNIIIDAILEREPFFNDSMDSLNKSDGSIHQGFILASSITDIYYICKKRLGHDKTIEIIKELVDSINVLNVNGDAIVLALHSNFADFEDAVQSASAGLNQVDLIV
ncbi:type II toxin-antitoxin system VapC family toxin [Pedobacter endophyticus]|uniref:PIN domain-containing protein n=1 Tax=Pedobacter endophyticus TaxID=2789740 RepID=A0A7S9L2L9_9SPHI|nr:PIN domain-containing protein [Pedobacter endophyticus]QPH41365.1 PIN domain-containing protein [Pedobacter endophyticus]